jgi:hypothetical protein
MEAMVADAVAGGPIATVAEALARMQAIDAALPPDDGLAHFNRMYLGVTEAVAERLSAGFFEDPAFMDRLDAVFANLYFEAVRASVSDLGRVPRAWGALLERRSDRRVAPIQFALAGMNAHINRDLPVAVVSTCQELGTTPDAGSHRRDYDRVDLVLAEVERDVRRSFEMGALLVKDSALPIVGDVIVNFKLLKARTAAWASAETLWTLGQVSTQAAAEYLDTLDGLVGFAGRGLLAPVVPVPDAPSAEPGRPTGT